MEDPIKKKEGFQGQKAVVIPRQILNNKCARNDVISTLYITDIGYYPKARFHYRERPQGADQNIILYCHEGLGEVIVDRTVHKVETGEFFIIPAKKAHTYAADDKNPWTIYWIHFKGTVSSHLVSAFVQKNGWKGFIRSRDKCLELFNEMYHQLERGYGSDTLMYANMCLWHFLTTFLYNDKMDTSRQLSNKDATDLAIDFLSRNIDKPLTLAEIAGQVNLSSSHFSYAFKKKTGFSPVEYFNHLKVQKACQYLLFTNLRVKEIAREVGIEDPYYFSRLFTKVMGTPPNDYREKRMH